MTPFRTHELERRASRIAVSQSEACVPEGGAQHIRWWLRLSRAWDRFWFQPSDPTTLGAVRVCTGLVLLYAYVSCTPRLMSLIGPDAWIDSRAITELRAVGQSDTTLLERIANAWWPQSVWFYVQDPRWIWTLHGLFLVAIVCFTLGFCSRTANVIVWVGHVSFVVRSYSAWFGFDVILGMLTFCLMFGPTGDALSVDAWLRRRRLDSQSHEPTERESIPSWSANASIRLIQAHMCVVYFCSGISKLPGATWRNGSAIWLALMSFDEMPYDLRSVSHLNEWVVRSILWAAVVFTLAFEIGFAFLIWSRRTRPFVLSAAVLLHLGIGVFMGLDAFSAAMLTGCLAFVPPATVRRALKWRPKLGMRVSSAPTRATRKSAIKQHRIRNQRRRRKKSLR
jgi:hypothetical protein